MEVDTEAVKTFYEESKAAKEKMDDLLKQYRSNTTVTLTFATAAATFFGFSDSPKGAAFVAALAAYGVGVILALSIYAPITWYYNLAHDFEDNISGLTPEKMYYDLGVGYQKAFNQARSKLAGDGRWPPAISTRFLALVVAAALTVILAGINVATAGAPAPDPPTRVIIERQQ